MQHLGDARINNSARAAVDKPLTRLPVPVQLVLGRSELNNHPSTAA